MENRTNARFARPLANLDTGGNSGYALLKIFFEVYVLRFYKIQISYFRSEFIKFHFLQGGSHESGLFEFSEIFEAQKVP